MGRTVKTYRSMMNDVIARWEKFARAIRKEDRDAFEEIIVLAKEHADASGYMASTDPLEGMFLSILLGQQKKVRELKLDIEKLRTKIEKLDRGQNQ